MNPNATSTSVAKRDVIVAALAADLELRVIATEFRGHAIEIAAKAAIDGVDLVLVLGGDGTVNEVINGLLSAGRADNVPMLAVVPGGSGNVFARILGFPASDPVEATGLLLGALRAGRHRRIGLGRLQFVRTDSSTEERWFSFNAGLGVDADTVASVERQRERGRRASPLRYALTAVHEYLSADLSRPVLSLYRPGLEPVNGLRLAIIQNASPWSYLGARPVSFTPSASFDTGLDLFAATRGSVAAGLWQTAQAVASPARGVTGSGAVRVHDASWLQLVAAGAPVRLQVDGDDLGPVVAVTAFAEPDVIRVVC